MFETLVENGQLLALVAFFLAVLTALKQLLKKLDKAHKVRGVLGVVVRTVERVLEYVTANDGQTD